MKKFRAISLMTMAALLLGGIFASPASAQFIGYTTPQTVQATPLNNVPCNTGALSPIGAIPNLGQTVHFLTWIGGGSAVRIVLRGGTPGAVVAISDTGTDPSGQGVLVVSGYYPILQVQVNCDGTAANITVNYYGTSVSAALVPGPLDIAGYTKVLCNGCAANAGFGGPFVPTPYGTTGGVLAFVYSGTGPGGSTIRVDGAYGPQGNNTAPGQIIPTTTLQTNSSVQFFTIPPGQANQYSFSYTSGGASASTFSAFYIFSKPGTTIPAGTYTHVTTTTATAAKALPGFLHSLNVNTAAAGTISIFDLTGASCTGTPATNVVAVITVPAATNGLPPFLYDVNLLQGICVKASVAMDYTVSSQ